jgi:N-acetylglucosamine-6-phosphate deacetylase
MLIIGRDSLSTRWIEVSIKDSRIHDVRACAGPEEITPEDGWLSPAFWDIQLNGRWGHSFSSPALTVDQVVEIIRAQAGLGTCRLCPTLITATVDDTLHGLRTIAEACERDPGVARMVLGMHLEGPFLSELDGYRGAHPAHAIRDPDFGLLEEFRRASGGRVTLMTLAPERPGAIDFIRQATAAGVTIALGHTAAEGPVIRSAVAAGARLSTHLGNGIAARLPRHPNPIWAQAAEDRLFASFIADGHHLDTETLRVLARAKGLSRVVLVSDASPLAGLPPGTYGDWAVDPSGRIVVAGTPYLAGSNQSLEVGLRTLANAMPCGITEALRTVTDNPATLLGRPCPTISAGESANLIVYRRDDEHGFTLLRTCVDGSWHDAAQ